MFSPANQEGGPAKGTRSSRRRQRPVSSDNSVQQPKAKRQRVPLSETTFVNPDAPTEMFEVKSDKLDMLSVKRDGIENVVPAPRKELSVRSKKPKAGERSSKGDGSIILTSNNAYAVSKLPALPDRLRQDAPNRQHGAIYASNGYALSLTHTHAFVWPYTSTASSPETFTFALPYPSKHASDPLPLGSLVAPSASSDEPGLVIVMPVSGKISYWESISSAVTLDFLSKQRTGVEDSISGMFSGEHVIHIVNAESAGFVLVLTSGRLAYMTVRDGHGRPGISVQFLRNGLSNNVGGFFGSIRHALSASPLRGDIAAVRSGSGTKLGERIIVAATTKGKLLSWRVHRGGHHELLTDVDIKDQLAKEIQETDSEAIGLPQDSLEVHDFTFIPRGLDRKHVDSSRLSQALLRQDDSVQHLLLLTSFTSRRQSRYSLVELVISVEGVKIGMVRPLTSYSTPARTTTPIKPRIYLPRPALVAFVIFDRAVVIASMVQPPDSPESQLQEDSHIIPATFEDVIDFRDEDDVQIVGSGIEEPTGNNYTQDELRAHRPRTKNPAAVLLLQGAGTVRVAVSDIERFASDEPPKVTAKTKLEQAVFFGVKEANPLVFQGRRNLPFSNKEIADAAIELSNEIVSSKSPFLASLSASLEVNMKTRVSYLDALIAHLVALHVELDARSRWLLLYNAEKMTVATWIWEQHERFLAERPKGDKKTLISETAVFINENQKTEPIAAIGEVDSVRHWFMHDVWRLDIFIAWGYQVIKTTWTEKLVNEAGLARLVWEAATVNNGALREAHRYRLSNARLYKIDPRQTAGGNAIPEPWTATHLVANNVKRLLEFCHLFLDTYFLPSDGQNSVDRKLLEQIRDLLPAFTRQYLTVLQEFSAWAAKSEDAQAQELGKTYRQHYLNDVYEKVLKLKDYDLWEQAIGLAQEYNALVTLADVVVQQILTLESDAGSPETTSSQAQEKLALADEKKQQMGRLMEKYHEKFAFRAYEVLLKNSGVQGVLDFQYDKGGYATKFLRTKPELAKISWINDVQREKDIDHAAETLLSLGLGREQQIWNKKIELSLGKLALMVEESEHSVNGDISSTHSDSEAKNGANLQKIDRELELIKIQDALYSMIFPTIREGVDAAAELELAMKEHGALIPKKQKALAQIFEDGMERLLKHEALQPFTLIDLLTLSYLDESHWDLIGDQFYLALRVAGFALKGEDRVNAERLIWRRCFIRDDWKRVNETNDKADDDQLATIGETRAYKTMFAVADENNLDKTFRPFVKPSDALGVYTEALDRRFDAMHDDFRHKLLDAMNWEDGKLRNFIEKARLDAWAASTRDSAEKTVMNALNRKTAEAKQQRDSRKQAVADAANAARNGRSGNANGNANGSSIVSAKAPFARLSDGERTQLFVA
ncbi:Non-repetitive/WGA-negative nucleoporin C-terminal-domain-containing protein [Apodospora peruviana]|uniref:Non-repetitive/WGA-negative nucleoporin C-terminal-domain-containing protein n=1 Tax=Apodospora peruviana TaxID=516989 RepID=A0AAE0I1G1_9PEZI|nr:Non-repetitive/WGA-negative nucleoporin C-terminal-domain-containing protein [Apodospora peruviana]